MPLRFLLACLTLLVPVFAQDSGFFQFSIDEDHLAGAPDFSFLNHALTPADRVVVRDGHFCRIGDGSRVRMFGVSFAFGASFPEPADAPRVAKRLRRLGINLVRLHHTDTRPDRNPDDANSTLTTGPYPTLNPVSIARMRNFLNALKAEGIYVDLNLHIGYEFRSDVDHVPAMPEGVKFPKQSKPLHIFYPRMVDLQVEYARKLIAALGLKDDPVLAMVEMDNEVSLLQAWQTRMIDKDVVGEYKTELERQWNEFLHAKYKTSETVPLVDAKKPEPGQRTDDFLLFLADRDHAYNARIMAAVKETAGKLVPVTGTQMNYGGLLDLDSQADLDYQDSHFYIDHYSFPHREWDTKDWRIRDQSAVGSGFSAILNIAALRVAGQPYTVSEFNEPWPNTHAAEIDPTLAVFAAFQDWDAIMHYSYIQSRDWANDAPSNFNISGDWTKYPNIGQSAWLLRSGAIQSGKQPVTIPISRELQLRSGEEKRNGKVVEFLKAEAGYDAAVAFLHPVAIRADSQHPIPETVKAAGAAPYRSDTGDIVYDPNAKLFLIQAREAAGVIGFTGRKTVTAGAMDVTLASDDPGFATIIVTALDGKAIGASSRLLLSTPGYTLRAQPGSNPPRPQKLIHYESAQDWWTIEPETAAANKPSGSMAGGIGPVWMKRVESFVTLRTTAKTLAVYPLDGRGGLQAPVRDVEKVAGGFRIHLQAEGQVFSPWYEVVAKR
jgi:hypothetical protein